jgi:hypothetical protein
MMYLINAKPYKDIVKNRLETFNEFVIFFVAYLLFGFTDWMQKLEFRIILGSVMIYTIILDIFVNFSLMGYEIFKLKRR